MFVTAPLTISGPATAVQTTTPFALAVTFDGYRAAKWLHTNLATAPVVATPVASGLQSVRRSPGAPLPPPDVAAVTGVVGGDRFAADLPAYSGTVTGADFAGLAVTPLNPGPNDALAPGLRVVVFGADMALDAPLPADARAADNGNNIVQRGLAGDDQYKVQADVVGSVRVVSCVVRDSATGSMTKVKAREPLVGGDWYRVRCRREVVRGVDVLTLTQTRMSTGATIAATAVGVSTAAVLDYPRASPTAPTPLAIGAKLSRSGEIESGSSDQFNGQVDNVYLAIG
jgi:hypothetical protein